MEERQAKPVDLARLTVDPAAVRLVPEKTLRRYRALPFARDTEALSVALADPKDLLAVEDLHLLTGLEIRPFLAPQQDIIAGIDAVYGGRSGMDDDVVIKYGMPDAPRKHLLILADGSMEVCGSEEAAASRIKELGRGSIEEVWEMRQRTVVRY